MLHYILSDNQTLTRCGLESLIRRGPEASIAVAATRLELFSCLEAQEDSIVLLDYYLFDFRETDYFFVAIDRFPKARWVLVSATLSDELLDRVVEQTQNVSILFKDSPLSEIADALRHAAQGQRYFCQRVAELFLQRSRAVKRKQGEQEKAHLTRTEVEVLQLMARGLTTRQIAEERSTSINTVNTHRKNIFRKLGVSSAHKAISHALRVGLLEPSEYS